MSIAYPAVFVLFVERVSTGSVEEIADANEDERFQAVDMWKFVH